MPPKIDMPFTNAVTPEDKSWPSCVPRLTGTDPDIKISAPQLHIPAMSKHNASCECLENKCNTHYGTGITTPMAL